jgi:hypothetical protein
MIPGHYPAEGDPGTTGRFYLQLASAAGLMIGGLALLVWYNHR